MSDGTSGDEERASGSWWAALEMVKADVHGIKGQLEEGRNRMERIELGQAQSNLAIAENTRLTKVVMENTEATADFVASLSSLLKFGNWLSGAATKFWKPASYFAMTVSFIVTAVVAVLNYLGK